MRLRPDVSAGKSYLQRQADKSKNETQKQSLGGKVHTTANDDVRGQKGQKRQVRAKIGKPEISDTK